MSAAHPSVPADPRAVQAATSMALPSLKIEDLLVQHVELEMQNAELRDMHSELLARNERFAELYDFAPVGYFSLAANGAIRQINYLGARLLGRERVQLLETPFESFLAAEQREAFRGFLARMFAGEDTEPLEFTLSRLGKEQVFVRITGVVAPNGQIARLVAMDVTRERLAEQASQQRNRDLDSIFNLSLDLMCIANVDGYLVRINPAFEELLGYPAEELTRRPLIDFVHADDYPATAAALDRLQSGAKVTDFVNRYICKDGTLRWIEWRATPLHDGLVCALGRDITKRRAAEAALRISEEKFRSIFESSPMGMYLYQLDAGGGLVLIDANPAAERETGRPHGTLRGLRAEQAFPALAGTGIIEMYSKVARGELGPQSFVTRYDDAAIQGHFDVRVFRTGPDMVVVAFTDISVRVRTEQELKESRADLEHRVRERTNQLRSVAHQLTQVEERERRRIASLIHDELQQTLVAASLSLRMLRGRIKKSAEPDEFDHLAQILAEAIQTSRTLTAELSPPVLHQSGLPAAFRWLAERCQDQYGLHVETELAEDVDTGPEMGLLLFRAVKELLFNVTKHAGVAEARLRMEHSGDGGLFVEVSDHGRGFQPRDISGPEGGSGAFGLFNVRERLEMAGGRLEVYSAPGNGSRLVIWMPSSTAKTGGMS